MIELAVIDSLEKLNLCGQHGAIMLTSRIFYINTLSEVLDQRILSWPGTD